MRPWMQALAAAVGLVVAAGWPQGASATSIKLLRVGFYLPWDAASKASLLEHASSLDVLAPMSAAVVSAGGSIRWQDDPARAVALASAARKPAVFPVVSNAHDNLWDAVASDGVILDEGAGEAFMGELVDQARAQGYGGYIMDFENLSPNAMRRYAPFLAKLRRRLRPLHRELWVTTTITDAPATIRPLADAADAVVLMAYDQCWATATPGPIAGQDWLQANLAAQLSHVDPAHYIVALGAYGYDWPEGQAAAVLAAPQAAQLATSAGQAVVRAQPDGNPRFTYRAADGRSHSVWFLDRSTFEAQLAAAAAQRVRGVAVWRMGLEDDAIWRLAPPPRIGKRSRAPRESRAAGRCSALPPSP